MGRIVCAFRLNAFRTGAEIRNSYAAQFYDLTGLSRVPGPFIELGRFCINPADQGEADILRLAWGILTAQVDAWGARWLIGCTSFAGLDSSQYTAAFARLKRDHLAPSALMPAAKSSHIVRFEQTGRAAFDAGRTGWATIPPLLRSYLGMGGWVSDHAVVDDDLGTLHVFTALEVRAIPAARAKLLRALCG